MHRDEIKHYERVVFPGRFQPVHLGHIHVIKWLLERSEEIIVVIGSAQKSHMLDNPFTAGERMMMFRSAFKEEGIDASRIYLVPVPDIEYNSIWVSYLESLLPPFNAVASRNPLVVRLFKERRYDIIVPPYFMRSEYSGMKIRELMLEGKNWRALVPKSVAAIIDSIGGVQRIIDSTLSDEVQG